MTAFTAALARDDAPTTPRPQHSLADAVLIAAVVVAGVVLRFVTESDLWLDEALSVNIAELPFSELREALRQDGAPPLYYALLHVWIDIFGSSDVAVRALSGVLSVATLPLAYLAGKRIGGASAGRTVGWAAVLLLASSPYAIRYATESRMYALVMFLLLWGYLALRRALESPTLGRLAVVALVSALLVNTQYWAFYVVAVVGIGLLGAWRWGSEPVRRAAPRIIVAIAIGGLTLIPWVSTLLYQLEHTGTPWADPVVPWFAIAEGIISFAGGDEISIAFLLVVPLLVLPLLALFGAPVDARRIELDLRTRPIVRWELAGAFGILGLGATAAWIGGTAFDGRYASVMYPLLVLAMAAGLTVFASPRVRVIILAVTVLIGFAATEHNVTTQRTQAGQVAAAIRAEAEPNDLVVYCPDQLGPGVHRIIEDLPLRHATFPDGARPERVDWVDYIDRIQAQDPAAFAERMLQRAGDSTIWYVSFGGYNNVEGVCDLITTAFDGARDARMQVAPDNEIFEQMGLTVFRGS